MVASSGISAQKPWQASVLATLGLCGIPISAFFMLLASEEVWGWFAGITVLAFVGSAIAGHRDRRRTDASYVLTPEGIEVHRAAQSPWVVISRREVLTGYEVPIEGSVELKLTGGRKLVIETAEPTALLEHLGVAVHQRALTIPLRDGVGSTVLGLLWLVMCVVMSGFAWASLLPWNSHGLIFPLTILSSIATIVPLLWRFGFPRVVVGADGIRVRGTIMQPFVPYGEILGVTAHSSGVHLQLRGGRVLQLETWGRTEAQVATLAARIGEGRGARIAEATTRADALKRGNRTLPAWREDLRRLALGAHDFRHQAYGPEDFEQILTSAGSSPDERIGAALALRVADPSARPRIRIAAAASANDDLRAALTECASERETLDDAPLHRATMRK